VRCTNCGRDNPDDARFCGGCGERILRDVVCGHCGRENPADARFCVECGSEIIGTEAGAPLPAARPPSTQPALPTSFAGGRYVMRRFLGEGGKKRVYLAHDARLDRDVAFALIKTEGLDAAARERITREAQAMGRLGNHPNIVTVYDIGEEPGTRNQEPGEGAAAAQPYLVLPVLEGGDVEGLIEKAPEHKLPIEQAVRIGIDTCEGLAFAHAKGIIHRDVKPGNTWLTTDGRAMVGDFGLAVAVDRSRLTQAGMMVGTVSYMPPEQAMGGEITPRSDLYALGAMLYEMVCGRPPFVGDESVAIIGQHLNTPPVAPSWHRPDCPPALEALILRLLEKDPEKRPTSAAEVRDALKGVSQSLLPGGEGGRRPDEGAPPSGTGATYAGADPLYRTVFVGREAELRQLQQAYDAAVSGQGGLVMVVGEPGIGKTALCEQLATYVSIRGGRTLVGHCYEEGSLSLPYLAFVEAMRTYVLARDPDGLRSDLGTGAADVARIVSEVRDRVAVELRDAGDPEDDRWRLLQSVTTFLRNAASVQPLVIVLEDLHWADRGTLDLLQHVARNLQGARLVVAGTYRDVEVDRAHPLSGALAELRRSGSFLRVPLRGLTVDEVHRMYEALRGNEVAWAQAELVHRQTEGNPLFVQEVLRYLVEEGYVVRQGDRYVPQQGVAQAVPEGLREVVGRRLSHLSEAANQVLSVAAVIGREFRMDVLQRVMAVTEDEMIAALEEAQGRAIIEEYHLGGSLGFRFTHAFFRQTLYEEIFAARRIRWHQQVARALEAVHGRRLDEHAAELAEHFSQSTDREDLEKAVHYGRLAAERAMAVFDYGEAASRLDQALQAQDVLDPDEDAILCDLQIALAEALNNGGDPRRALEDVAPQALRLAEALGDASRASHICSVANDSFHAFYANRAWDTPEAASWAQAADRSAVEGTVARVLADAMMGRVQFATGNRAEAVRLLERSVGLARELGDNATIWAAGRMLIETIAGVAAARSRFLDIAEDLHARPREGVSSQVLRTALYFLFNFFFSEAQRNRVDALVAEMSDLATRTKQPNLELTAAYRRATLLAVDGRLSESLSLFEEIWQRAADLGLNRYILPYYATRIRVLMFLGHREEIAKLRGELPTGVPVVESLFAAASGDIDGARASIDKNLALIVHMIDEGDALPINPSLEAAILSDHATAARQLFSISYEVQDSVVGPQTLACGGRIRGDAACYLGEYETARAHYSKALDSAIALRFRPEIALIRLDLAELLLGHYPEERDAAIEHLDFAIGEFREMKMQPSLERALRHRGLLKA